MFYSFPDASFLVIINNIRLAFLVIYAQKKTDNVGLKRMGRGGFEPPKQFAADLQSVPFGHSGICPFNIKLYYLDREIL